MVRLWIAGGSLSSETEQLQEAARRHSSGDAVSAIAIYRAILEKSPQQAEALHMLGVIAMQAGNATLALSMVEAALAAQQDYAEAWTNRALILHGLKRPQEALQSAQLAVQSAPGLAAAWDMLGLIAHECGDEGLSEQAHRRAIALQPDNSHFHGNLAALLLGRGDLEAAYRAGLTAESLSPSWPSMTLGNIFKAMGHPEKALPRYIQTRALRPDFVEATVSEAMALLHMGDMENGWRLWEQRPDLSPDLQFIPFWKGQKTDSLLIYEDQGLGDAVHFARYIPWLRAHTGRLVCRVADSLRPLFAENFEGMVFVEENAVPQAQARCRLSSLPFFAETRFDTLPPASYLKAAEAKRVLWREKLPSVSAPRIGVVWAGNPAFRSDKSRSLKKEDIQQVVEAVGARYFVSLQKNATADLGIYDAAPQLHDFSDTAALMAELDLIVAVDTAAAHLAGALGKPVFILLPFDNDWRWLIGREDSPWYPSARLWRQNKARAWPPVTGRLTEELKKLVAGDRRVLSAGVWQGACLRQNPDALGLDA